MSGSASHREAMSRYYALHSRIYDVTRWAFLFGREAILDDLRLRRGERVLEVGCGTGSNIRSILKRIGSQGELVAVDCSEPMIKKCRQRIRSGGWRNVHLVDKEYGTTSITGGAADVVLMSYSLSMIPSWKKAIQCALMELKPRGRVGVVDFCLDRRTQAAVLFAHWMQLNHVSLDRPYREELASLLRPVSCITEKAPGGLWSFYRFVGHCD
jgi:S-adenosylmethionine-diacylgycerolhomoserine-N-methlytransferase